MRIIDKIEVHYFRSLFSAQLDQTKDLNIIFGRNDSGKSNLLKALNLFFNNKVDDGDAEYRTHFDFSMNLSDARKTSAKKFVWIKVTFNTPPKYAGTLGEKVVIKRQWNSTGKIPDEAWIINGKELIGKADFTSSKKTQLTRFLNDIDFAYIPAIKDRDSFARLIERMYGAISQNAKFIQKTNHFISAIGEEAANLTNSISNVIPGNAVLSPPTDMERLFRNLDFSVGIGQHSLLRQKGDGIKARYIPEILRFINESESRKKLFVWGFEEPENSLDLEAASSEARRFKAFSTREDTQVFITSHSPAFYLAEADELHGESVKRFFVTKQESNDDGNVYPEDAITPIDDIMQTEKVMEGAGLLRLPYIIKHVAELNEMIASEQARTEALAEEITAMKAQIENLERPTLYTEGIHDKYVVEKILDAMNKKDAVNVSTLGGTPKTAHAIITSVLRGGGITPGTPIFFLFDNDKAGRGAAEKISNQNAKALIEPVQFAKDVWTWILPLDDDYREFLARWNLSESNAFHPMEFMFPAHEAAAAYESILNAQNKIPGLALDDTIQGDIWDGVKSNQALSRKITGLNKGNIDWFYSRGVDDNCKAAFSEACINMSTERIRSVLSRILFSLDA
ncbi:AAA15 family ATPase/GTPase [Rhodobacter aestuarii]|uniref:ATPase/GTPase, AAA15 family n=1 Tax=Rhodobacter aestuarii TaxID=453582 RepID=A0A1N7JKN2_9RHOB|nr:AAA family ATPase [Rhodobacter aestuarii]PTV96100.1 AAA15 family ATPase/GTPase [Rhodobacter aestuarii]SIS49867.1 ATPase/GTPase, AAA15 family [Rhodobacter aestuarii]